MGRPVCHLSVPWIRHEADTPNPPGDASGVTVGSLGVLGEAVVAPLIGPGGSGNRADRRGGSVGGGRGRGCRADAAGELCS